MTEESKTPKIITREQKNQLAEQEAEAYLEELENGGDRG